MSWTMLRSPVWQLLDHPVIAGDCVEVMAAMEPCSVDAVVCDPLSPYGLEFMGREWDRLDEPAGDTRQPGDATFQQVDNPYGRSKVRYGQGQSYGPRPRSDQPGYVEGARITDRPDAQVPYGRGGGVNSYQAGRPMQAWHERWAREALRVLKPGGYLIAAGSSRTHHRLICGVEDAGFEIRDCITWLYGSGFPKSLNVTKEILKLPPCTCDVGDEAGVVDAGGPSAAVRAGVGAEASAVGLAGCAAGTDGVGAEIGAGASCACLDVEGGVEEGVGELAPVVLGASAVAGFAAGDEVREDVGGVEVAPEPLGDEVVREIGRVAAVEADGVQQDGGADRGPADSLVLPGAAAPRGVAGAGEPGAVVGGHAVPVAVDGDLRARTGSVSATVGADEGGGHALKCEVCGGVRRELVPDGLGTALKPAAEFWTVARKPVPATVVANVLRHSTGALNIAAARIGAAGGRSVHADGGESSRGGTSTTAYGDGLNGASSAPLVEGLGRWPANVVVSHAAGCRLLGTTRVRSAMGVSGGDPDGNGIFNGAFPRGDGRSVGYGDEDGMEVVEAWECADGCPIKALDEQSGATGAAAPASGPTLRGENTSVARGRFAGLAADQQPAFHGDAGGASRFYFQAGDEPERWECVEGCPVRELDEQTRHLHTAGNHPESMGGEPDGSKSIFGIGMRGPSTNYRDAGGASRFFYCPKASPAERNAGLDDFELQPGPSEDYGTKAQHPMKPEGEPNIVRATRNPHPTVKPIELMRWLLRLVTPPGGIVLDPFAGSGTTGCAAALEGIAFVGIERDAEFVPLARARVAWWQQQPKHSPVEPLLEAEAKRRVVRGTGQASLFG